MKLSHAIMLNGMTKPQGFGIQSVGSADAPCAIGGALQAIGKQTVSTIGRNNYRHRHLLWIRLFRASITTFAQEWPWVRLHMECPACGLTAEVTRILWRLNDLHEWTRQQIAEWVSTVEPVDSSTANASAVDADVAPNREEIGAYSCEVINELR